MSKKRTDSLEYLPLLSRGKHRKPRQGACFMEFASYLAGERWTDHPACTHPLLASLARQVNDRMSEGGRQDLLELVPDVIGLTSSDIRIDATIALRAGTAALPVASEERQRAMAVAVWNCERLLAALDGHSGRPLSSSTQWALDRAPAAAAWAERHRNDAPVSHRVFRRQTAPAIVGCAVDGIARACIDNPDRLLHDLLTRTIHDCRTLCPELIEPPTCTTSYSFGNEGDAVHSGLVTDARKPSSCTPSERSTLSHPT